jgi:transcription elongation factor Elf1
MEPVDGNAIGGLLLSVFGAEQTAVLFTCVHCGTSGPLAECVVYRGGPGTVVRCRTCDGQLMVFVRRGDVMCVDLLGVR